jgi:hypothetical protein
VAGAHWRQDRDIAWETKWKSRTGAYDLLCGVLKRTSSKLTKI